MTAYASHDFDHASLAQTAHRPWPLPERPWVMTQTWHDLLFAHWPVDPRAVRDKIPAAFALDLFDARAWVGVVPFYMTNVAPRGVPSLPVVSEFPELNVRTYVTVEGRPGVFFFSLDAGSAVAAHAARLLLNLPYYAAAMSTSRQAAGIDYRCHRHGPGRVAQFRGVYQPIGDAITIPVPGTLEHFLTERYCLYAVNRHGAPYRLDIHHAPWRLQRASAQIGVNTMADAAGIALPDSPPLLHFSRRQDMVAWLPERTRPPR